jgi:hypothetical protein
MVTLTNPDPQNPAQGQEFSVTANGGTPPYTFSWRISEDGSGEPKEQTDPTHSMTVPPLTQGQTLTITVTDSSDPPDTAYRSWTITVAGQGK